MTNKEEELLFKASKDTIAFGKLFLPDDFLRSETPPFHYEVADALDDRSVKQLAIILPRGHGKTVLTKANIVKNFCFADKDDPLFYGWVSATAKLATGNMDYVKTHFEMNQKIQYYFGNLKGKKWTSDDIELTNGCKLLSKSNVSGIRGGAKMHKRYDLVILDDFEDENNTITQESRQKNANLITAVVYPALEPATGRLRINGTPVHFDSFVNNLIVGYEKAEKQGKDFSWKCIIHKAVENGCSLWDSWFPMSKLEEKKKFYMDSGQPQKYWQEYHMQVQSEEDAIWTQKHLKYYDGVFRNDGEVNFINIDGKDIPINTYVGVDPATDTVSRDTDFSVLLVIGIDDHSNIYVLDYLRKRSISVLGIVGDDKKGIVDYMFDLEKQYKPHLFCVEDTTMSRAIFSSLISEMRRRNDFGIKFKEEKPGTRQSKRERIQEVLASRFATGTIHLREEHIELIQEILQFGPRMAHDDTIDALAYACKYATLPSYSKIEGDDETVTYEKERWANRSWVVA